MTDQKKKLVVIEASELQNLIDVLRKKEFQIYGPSIESSAIVYQEINTVGDLPVGWSDSQDSGHYRLTRNKKDTFFDYTVGPHSWKKYLHPPERQLLEVARNGRSFELSKPVMQSTRKAFIGVRACELHAISRQDRILMDGEFADSFYTQARKNLFIVAVNCTRPNSTCFCASMKTGPKADEGFDLALTEISESNRHYFVTEVGSDAGGKLIKDLALRAADSAEIESAQKAVEKAAGKMGRQLDSENIQKLLYKNYNNAYWEEIASRCLTCGNCTLVCPTCFCTNTTDTTDLGGQHAGRRRQWDSCFTVDFSYIHGGSIRASDTSRYRQWLMHKLAYWQDQFGAMGCVGCGRCITWCPVGIDITEEARKICK